MCQYMRTVHARLAAAKAGLAVDQQGAPTRPNGTNMAIDSMIQSESLGLRWDRNLRGVSVTAPLHIHSTYHQVVLVGFL